MEKEVVKDVVQEIKVPQVKALHPFSGQGLKMAKGEVGVVIECSTKALYGGGGGEGGVLFCSRRIENVKKQINHPNLKRVDTSRAHPNFSLLLSRSFS